MNLHPKPAQQSILCEDSKVSTQDPEKNGLRPWGQVSLVSGP
jgi:hypothetical protein